MGGGQDFNRYLTFDGKVLVVTFETSRYDYFPSLCH